MGDMQAVLKEAIRRMIDPNEEERDWDFVASRTITYAPGSPTDPEVILAHGGDPGFYRYVCVVPDAARRWRDEKRWKKMLRQGKRKPRKK